MKKGGGISLDQTFSKHSIMKRKSDETNDSRGSSLNHLRWELHYWWFLGDRFRLKFVISTSNCGFNSWQRRRRIDKKSIISLRSLWHKCEESAGMSLSNLLEALYREDDV
jgi:hypothetical protein